VGGLNFGTGRRILKIFYVHKSCEKWRLGNNKKECDLSLGKNNKKSRGDTIRPVPYKKTRPPKTNKNPYRHQLLLLRMFMHSEKDIEGVIIIIMIISFPSAIFSFFDLCL
jgi:hypothetical protein